MTRARDIADLGQDKTTLASYVDTGVTSTDLERIDITTEGTSENSKVVTTNSSGHVTLAGELRGPATFVVDPAAVGDNTGLLQVKGNLQVDGTTTTINSTTLTVDDKNIVLGSGAADSAAADGSGITIDGASATMLYTHSTTSFDFNKPVNVTGNATLTGSIAVDDIIEKTSAHGVEIDGVVLKDGGVTSSGLTVESASGQLTAKTTGDHFPGVIFDKQGTSVGAVVYDTAQDALEIYTDDFSGSPQVTVDNAGNVAIGSTASFGGSATKKYLSILNTDGTDSADRPAVIELASSNKGDGVRVGEITAISDVDGGDDEIVSFVFAQDGTTTNNVGGKIRIQTKADGGSLADRMIIDQAGDVSTTGTFKGNLTAGSGKTIDVSAGTLTLADNQISGNKVDGGDISGLNRVQSQIWTPSQGNTLYMGGNASSSPMSNAPTFSASGFSFNSSMYVVFDPYIDAQSHRVHCYFTWGNTTGYTKTFQIHFGRPHNACNFAFTMKSVGEYPSQSFRHYEAQVATTSGDGTIFDSMSRELTEYQGNYGVWSSTGGTGDIIWGEPTNYVGNSTTWGTHFTFELGDTANDSYTPDTITFKMV